MIRVTITLVFCLMAALAQAQDSKISKDEIQKYKNALQVFEQAVRLEEQKQFANAEVKYLEVIQKYGAQKVLHPWIDGYRYENHFGESSTFGEEAKDNLALLRCRMQHQDGQKFESAEKLADEIIAALKTVSKDQIEALLDCRTTRGGANGIYDSPELPSVHAAWLLDERVLLKEKKLDFTVLKKEFNEAEALIALSGFRDYKELLIELVKDVQEGWIWFSILETQWEVEFPRRYPEKFHLKSSLKSTVKTKAKR